MAIVNEARATQAAPRELGSNPRQFTAGQRLQIAAAARVGYWATWAIGRTLRWQVDGWEHWEAARAAGKGLIYTFWHREICAATWFWRKRGIIVMTSQNFDGEYIARIIQKHGYGAARGSSSRGAGRALVEMIQGLRGGRDAAFTIDGPRGPRFVAKQGSVLLAKATGAAIVCFHIALDHAHVFRKSWDQLQIPRPFSAAAIFIAPPLFVRAQADAEQQAQNLGQVQAALDGLQARGAAWLAARRPAG